MRSANQGVFQVLEELAREDGRLVSDLQTRGKLLTDAVEEGRLYR